MSIANKRLETRLIACLHHRSSTRHMLITMWIVTVPKISQHHISLSPVCLWAHGSRSVAWLTAAGHNSETKQNYFPLIGHPGARRQARGGPELHDADKCESYHCIRHNISLIRRRQKFKHTILKPPRLRSTLTASSSDFHIAEDHDSREI